LFACAAMPGTAAPLEDAEGNFRFDPPPAPWVRARPRPDDRARFVFIEQQSLMMRLRIVADDTGAPADVSDEELLANALDRFINPRSMNTRVIATRDRIIDGIPGKQISTEITDATGFEYYDVSWLGSRAGIVYWLNLSSGKASLDDLVIESRDLFDRLSILDPQRIVSALAPDTRLRSERFGYSIDLTGTGIVEADRDSWPERVEFTGTLPGHDLAALTLLVIPVFLRDLPVDPDLADVALCNLVQPAVPIWRPSRTADAEGARIREYEAMIPQSGRMVSYRARILQRDGYFIAVSVSVNGAGRDRTQTLLDTTGLLRLDPSPPSHSPDPSTSAERLRQALFYNALGMSYIRVGRFAEAVSFFERADAPGTNDPTYAGNLANARLRAGRPRDAALGADQALKRFPMNTALLGLRGLALFTLGEHARAGEDLRLAYEGGNRSEDVTAAYALTLAERQHFDGALAVLDRQIAQNPAPGARLLRSIVLHRAGRGEEATAEMVVLLRERPGDPTLLGALLGSAIQNGDPATFLVATDDLVTQDPTGMVLYLRAFAQHALGRTAAAIEGLDQALQVAPDSQAIRSLREQLVQMKQNGSGRGA